MKKRNLFVLLFLIVTLALSSCNFDNSGVGTKREQRYEKAVSFFKANREVIFEAVKTRDFSALETLEGVKRIKPNYLVEINIGGFGWISEGMDYGIFYYLGDYIEVSKYVSDSRYKEYMKPTEDGGYITRDSVGDNYEYIRLIEDRFWFYEEGW